MSIDHEVGGSRSQTLATPARPFLLNPAGHAVAAAAVMLVGSVGPWATAVGARVDVPASGLVFFASLACLAVLIPQVKRRRGRRRLVAVAATAGFCALAALLSLVAISDASQSYFGLVQPGWGVGVTLLGAAATTATSVRLVLLRREVTR